MENSRYKQENDIVNMTLPAKAEYVGVVRLAVSAIANRMGFDIEEIEDIKVAVAEACTNAIKHSNCDKFFLKVSVCESSLEITVEDDGDGYELDSYQKPNLDEPNEDGGLGIYIIHALMDEVDISSKTGEGSRVNMIKYLGDEK